MWTHSISNQIHAKNYSHEVSLTIFHKGKHCLIREKVTINQMNCGLHTITPKTKHEYLIGKIKLEQRSRDVDACVPRQSFVVKYQHKKNSEAYQF